MTDAAARLVLEHMEWARHVAVARARSLPRHVELEDLTSEAMVGLVKAAVAYDEKRGIPFRSFAGHKVNGAIGDYCRGLDHLSRDTRDAINAGTPTWTDGRGIPAIINRDIHSLDEPPEQDEPRIRSLPHVDPSQEYAADLVTVLGYFPQIHPRAAEVLFRHAVLDESLLSIGESLGYTESRMCQLVKQGREELAALMATRDDDA